MEEPDDGTDGVSFLDELEDILMQPTTSEHSESEHSESPAWEDLLDSFCVWTNLFTDNIIRKHSGKI